MQRILPALAVSLALLAAAPAPAAAQASRGAAPDTTTPAIVVQGLQVYAKDGLRAAIATLLRGSPVDSAATTEQMVNAVGPIEVAYGRMLGHEVVRTVNISPSVRRVYAVLRYEKGPLYAYFDCYRAASGWIIPMFLTNTQAAMILPPDMLAGSPARP